MVPSSSGSADAWADKKSGTCSSVSLVLCCAAHQTARPATYIATLLWETLSVLGAKAKLSGSNLFTRLNYWIVTLGGQVLVTPPEINSVEAPSSATIVCQGDTFTFKLDQAPADNGGIFLVIEATEGKSNGVSRAHASAAAIKLVEEPTSSAVDIRADYVAKNGAPSAAAPKIFFRYYLVDSSTGVKSQVMLAETKWEPGA